MIKQRLKDFKLSGIYGSYEERVKYATDKSLSYEEFLELILEDEVNNRADNSYKKRYSKAKFPYHKKIEDFDFGFQPSINKRTLNDISTCQFVAKKHNVVSERIQGPFHKGPNKQFLSTDQKHQDQIGRQKGDQEIDPAGRHPDQY